MSKLYVPTCIYQEDECVKKYGNQMKHLGKHALIVTGKHSAFVNGSLDDVKSVLEQENIEYTIFSEIEENPSIETCEKAKIVGIEAGVDFVIGIGGGSPLDAAKAIALLLANPEYDGSVFYEEKELGYLPVVEVPTTCGTGSEVTPYAILTIHKKRTKSSISHRIYPVYSFCDGKYLKAASRNVLVNTAVDALCHMIESYFNSNSNLDNRMYSEYGMKLWMQAAPQLCADEVTDETRQLLLAASTYAGMAITHTGTSLPHALSYPVTYEMGVPHGKACGKFLPGYLALCCEKMPQDGNNVLKILQMESVEQFAQMLQNLIGTVEVDDSVKKRDVQELMSNPKKLKNCPFAVTTEEVERLFFI